MVTLPITVYFSMEFLHATQYTEVSALWSIDICMHEANKIAGISRMTLFEQPYMKAIHDLINISYAICVHPVQSKVLAISIQTIESVALIWQRVLHRCNITIALMPIYLGLWAQVEREKMIPFI